MKNRILEGKKLEWAGLILFSAAYVVISAFHEPWYDEAQAWQIAKCAGLREMLFEIPHYEGHPPLWHLILAIPAKLGVPFEIGLKTVGFLFSAASAALMLFRSRLPRPLRLALPFTYFFFYQYGVIVRPYGLMLLVLLLLGMELGNRKNHPWRTALLLGALCLTSAYGILIAGGIAGCIVWELWREKKIKRLATELLRDHRTTSLLALLALAIVLILEVFPEKDTYALDFQEVTTLHVRLFCAFFTFPLECFLSTSSWFRGEQNSMQTMYVSTPELLLCAVVGLVLWVGIICASSKKSLKFFLVPYLLYAAFAATIYFTTHHLGITFLLSLFWAELTAREEGTLEIGRSIAARISRSARDRKLLRLSGTVLLLACMGIPLFWTAAASVKEIRLDYYFARDMAAFLKETGLSDGLSIFLMWGYGGAAVPEAQGNEDYINTSLIGGAVPLAAYFDRNIVFNLNGGNDSEAFVKHRTVSYEESRATAEAWRSHGAPDVVIGYPNLKYVYGAEISAADYTCIYMARTGLIWKNSFSPGTAVVYLRNDLLEEYDLPAVNDAGNRYWHEGTPITDEMREAFENGVPMEEILKPYLDAMFGEED